MVTRNCVTLMSAILLPAIAISASWSDSGIMGPPYSEILKKMHQWRERSPNLITLVSFGTTVQHRPLELVLLMKKGNFPHRPALIMSGSTHGDEYLHIEDRLPAEILKKAAKAGPVQRFLDQGGAFVFIPIMNPDGYEARARKNARGVDLNRDWDLPSAGFKASTQPETRQLKSTLEKLSQPPFNLVYRISVDYHCCAGALLYPWAYRQERLPEQDYQRHLEISEMASNLLRINTGPTNELLGYYPMGTTKDYYYSQYRALSFTYEGRFAIEDQFFEKHVRWWEAMVEYLEKGERKDGDGGAS